MGNDFKVLYAFLIAVMFVIISIVTANAIREINNKIVNISERQEYQDNELKYISQKLSYLENNKSQKNRFVEPRDSQRVVTSASSIDYSNMQRR